VTTVGRLNSAQARLTHGLTAKARCLPGEDLESAARFAEALYDDLRPQGAHQNQLAGMAIDAARSLDRCQRALNATLSEQLQTALANIHRLVEEEVARYVALLPQNPYEAVAGLRGTSLGCQWLISQWELLRQAIVEFGCFTSHHEVLMVRLSGAAPMLKKKVDSTDFVFFNVEKFFIELHALYCRPVPPDPSELRMVFQGWVPGIEKPYLEKWPTRETHQAELLRRIEAALTDLRAREESLRTGPEAAQKALAADRSLVIQDLPECRGWVRYYSEHKSTYLRATKELRLLQDREADDDSDAEESAKDEEVAPDAVPEETSPPSAEVAQAASEVNFPNDPKVQIDESLVSDKYGPYVPYSGKSSETPPAPIIEVWGRFRGGVR
jgi:hypothetical protein